MADPIEASSIFYSQFAVDTRAACVWDWNLAERNLDFIRSIDPNYFAYLATVHGDALSKEPNPHSALALRMAYSHAIETFFALVCSTLQAPDCVVGWMTEYVNKDLRSVVEKIQNGEQVLTKLPLSKVSWVSLSSLIHAGASTSNPDWPQLFAKAWGRFACEFLGSEFEAEYNSAKHGLRTKTGGFRLAFRRPGDEQDIDLGGSEYGTRFFKQTIIHKKPRHFYVRQMLRNWQPENFVYGLHILGISISNLIAYLRWFNHDDSEKLTIHTPADPSLFEKALSKTVGVTSIGMD